MNMNEGKPEQLKIGYFSGIPYRALLTEFPDGQIVASIVLTDNMGTREYKCEIVSQRDEAIKIINQAWTELENNHK
ncbi:hypothetical protein [Paenibacillus sp. 22594]|uniref:hypothetical protein n=1 Tax=Paenibacillus sp. 22594 TaxID=3453947 RepID=UPI003F87F903